MTDEQYDPRDLIADTSIAILATIKANGLPQLSPVTSVYDRESDTILVSMTDGRAKTANLRRDPRAAIEFTSPDGYTWATAEGDVELIGAVNRRRFTGSGCTCRLLPARSRGAS